MVNKNIQEYLNKTYDKNTKKIKFSSSLQLSEQGTLVISDYPELESIRATGSGEINNITQVTIANCPQLKKININNFGDNEQLAIKDCPNLEILYCDNNKLTNLDVSSCANLTELWFSQNQLTHLTLPNQNNLEQLYCWGNNLTKLDFLKNCNPEKLAELSLGDNNFPAPDLTIFSPFKELKALYISGTSKPSYFTGSLKPLQDLKKLETLHISGTDITHGLEYLPESVKTFYCAPMRPNAQVIDIYEELQPFGGDINKWREVKLEKKERLLLAPLMPAELRNKENNLNEAEKKELEDKLESLEDIRLAELFKKLSLQQEQPETPTNSDWNLTPNYTTLHFNHWKLTNPLSPQESPLRLYDFKENKVYFNLDKKEENKHNEPTKNLNCPYAILSYVWGDRGSKAMKNSPIKRDNNKKETSNSASKAISKALKALEVINQELKDKKINYLWVDQLCMNQEDQHEKSSEVPKMGKYYDNSTLTLISLENKIGDTKNIDLMDMLKIIVNSEWFSRSWTYQEGWLSKWTVFMFDDILVDGRAMAGTWALNQLRYVGVGYNSRSEFDRGTKKIATPVGWVYYRNGYDKNDKVELTLTQTLYAIKNRKRTEPLDGIYSILGLLPYGKDVKVSYDKVKTCKCSNKKDCEHPEVNNTPELALQEVMQVAIANGYAEPLSWLGISNPKSGLCWMPEIDSKGSTSVMGSVGRVNSIYKALVGTNSKDTVLISPTNQGLDFTLKLPHYIIYKDQPETTHKLESGFEIEGGLYRKEVIVQPRDGEEKIPVSLLGTQDSLKQAQAGNILVVLYKEWFGTNKLLALLVKRTEQKKVYHRLGLVELVDSAGIKFTKIYDKFHKKTILGSEYQAQIQIPPKK